MAAIRACMGLSKTTPVERSYGLMCTRKRENAWRDTGKTEAKAVLASFFFNRIDLLNVEVGSYVILEATDVKVQICNI